MISGRLDTNGFLDIFLLFSQTFKMIDCTEGASVKPKISPKDFDFMTK